MRQFLPRAGSVLLALVFFAASASAQSNTGRLVGTVTDPQKGAVVGATVTVTDNQTGKELTTTTSEEGTFNFPQLDPGTYTVKVVGTGFKTFTATELKIDVGREYGLNVPLEPGGVTENVTVVAGADIVNATTGELSTTIDLKQVRELPLNGRNPLGLIQSQMGVSSNGATNTSINGTRPSFTNVTRDGLNVQDNYIRTNATDFVPDRPNTDDVGEITIVTQNAGPELGYGSSQVQLVTPRGSSDFHGTVYEYNRNSKFTANSFFRNLAGTAKPFLNRNQFGFNLGGPMPIPRFGEGGTALMRGKGFFFVNYDGFRQRSSTLATRTILLADARNGVFTYTDNAGTRRTINILQLAGLPGIDPVIQSRILANLPTAGNRTDIGDQLNTTGFAFNQKQDQDRDGFTTRLDYEISDRHAVTGTFSYKKELLLRPDVDAGVGGAGAGFNTIPFGLQDNHTPFLALSYRYSSGGNFTNEVRGGLQTSDPIFNRTDEPTDIFLGLPLVSSPESVFQAQGRRTKYYNLQDNAVYVWGNHSLRFGGQVQWYRVNPFGPPAFTQSSIPTVSLGTNPNQPTLTNTQFPGGISNTQLGTANSLLALLGGLVSSANLTFNATGTGSGYVPGALRQRNFYHEHIGPYIGDQWRVSPSLTLNLGLRYEIFRPVRERDRLALEPVIADGADPVAAILNPNATYDFVGTNAGGSRFFNLDKNNFAPSISFAYTPQFKNNFLGALVGDNRTVLRAGYRISYANDDFLRATDAALASNLGLTQTVTLNNLSGRLSQGAPAFTAPTFQVPRTFAQNNALSANFGTVFGIDPNLQVPMTQEWNIGIQRELGFQTAFEIRYVGGMSDNLQRALDFNQVEIFNNGFLADFLRARSNLELATARNAAEAAAGVPAANRTPISGAFNSAVTGSQQLTVFPTLGGTGAATANLNNATVINLLRLGEPGQLAFTYINTFQLRAASNLFLANPNIGVAELLGNYGKYRYNSLQTEIRRRFSQGVFFAANYTFQKTLTDAPGLGQSRLDANLNNRQPELEYARSPFDQAHTFHFSGIYELPFGKGKRWLNQGGVVDKVIGGWQLTSLVTINTGAPISITDPRGTLNRAGFSGNQTAATNLTKDQIKNLIGIRKTPCGVFFIDPAVININQQALNSGNCSALTGSGGFTGRGAEGFGTTPFSGQAFFNVAPGRTGNMERYFINGPLYANWDASIIKNFRFWENVRFQVRGEAFNVLNRVNFFSGNMNINSTNFGRITSEFGPRVVQFVGRLEF
jgi:hypothetical protein